MNIYCHAVAIILMGFLISCISPDAKKTSSKLPETIVAKDNQNINCTQTVDSIRQSLLNHRLRYVWSHCYRSIDTLLIGEDEETQWTGKAFFNQTNELALLAESNWQDTTHIYRITIYDKAIQTKDGVHVGLSFGQIKNAVSPKVPSAPDGYLFINDKNNNTIHFELDISALPEEAKIRYGVNTLSEIPDSLKVTSIVILSEEQ